jgi:hypothetical protein
MSAIALEGHPTVLRGVGLDGAFLLMDPDALTRWSFRG